MTIIPEEERYKVKNSTTESPVITAVIPTFRRPKLVKRAIESALNQTYRSLRVLVCDNASDDETGEVVTAIVKKDPRVFYLRHPQNMGAMFNFNFGIKNVQTPFFSMLCDDDILLPGFYKAAMKGFKDYPSAGFFAASVFSINSDGKKGGVSDAITKDACYSPPEGLLEMFKDGRNPPTWTGIVFKKEVVERNGLLDERLRGPADWDFVQRAAAHFSYVVSKTPGAIFVLQATDPYGVNMWWPDWHMMVANITDDKSIPFAVREKFRAYSLAIFKKLVLHYAKRALKHKNYMEASQAANILYKELNARILAVILYLGTKCLQCFPFLHSLIGLYVSRPRLKPANSGEISQYKRFLKPDG